MNNSIAEIEKLKDEILEKKRALKALLQKEKREEIQNYTFKDVNGQDIDLFSLFTEDTNELLVIHNMGKACKHCTLWADVFNASYPIITTRVPIILTSPNEYEILDSFSKERNWSIPCYSYHNSSFAKDLGYEFMSNEGKKQYWPGISSLYKEEGKIYRFAKDTFGPNDSYCTPWNSFELLKNGVNWQPT